MKILLLSAILYSVVFFSACTSPNITTIVHSDGSIERIIVSKADSSFMAGDTSVKPFPVEMDKNWNLQWKKQTDSTWHKNWPVKNWNKHDGDKPNEATVMISRKFSSVEEMEKKFQYRNGHAWHTIKSVPHFKKSFRWFYTYYTYTETFPELSFKEYKPLEKYMTKDEIGFWLTGTPALTKGMNGIEMQTFIQELEQKFSKWQFDNIWAYQYRELVEKLADFPGSPSKSEMLAKEDSIFKSKDGGIDLGEIKIQDNSITNMGDILNKQFHTNAFTPLNNSENEISKSIINPPSLQKISDQATTEVMYHLMMPGKIIEANGVLNSDTISWKLNGVRMMHDNYVIKAVSRKLNIWACILAVAIVMAAVYFALKIRG